MGRNSGGSSLDSATVSSPSVTDPFFFAMSFLDYELDCSASRLGKLRKRLLDVLHSASIRV